MEIRKKKNPNKEFKIINSMKKALWESIPCTCKKEDIMKSHPIETCEFCRCEIAWESVPQESFKLGDKQINSITLVRGKHQDIIGWEMYY